MEKRTVNSFEIDEFLEPEKVYEAIAEGVDRAVWRMITSATAMPCQDFYDAIKDAAERAFSKAVVSADDSA